MAEGGLFVGAVKMHRRGGERYKLYENGPALYRSDLETALKFCVEQGLVERGTTFVICKEQDEDLGDQWSWAGDDFIALLRGLVDVQEFTGLHKRKRSSINDHAQVLARIPNLQAPQCVMDLCRDVTAMLEQIDQYNSLEPSLSDRAFTALQKLGEDVETPDVADPIYPLNQRYAGLLSKYPLLPKVLSNHSWREDEVRKETSHYLKLEMIAEQAGIALTPVVGDAEDESDGDDCLSIDFDEEEDDEDTPRRHRRVIRERRRVG